MKKASTFAEVDVNSSELKICSRCDSAKFINEFYRCQGKIRSECKECTIRKNVYYQKQVQAWKHRFVHSDKQRSYMVEYYAKNKERFAGYRRKFKEKYPDYRVKQSEKRQNKVFIINQTPETEK